MQELNWNDLRYILALGRKGAFAGAARALKVNETTVARRIQESEEKIGAQLFERRPGGLYPTQAGSLAIASAEKIESEIQCLGSTIAGTNDIAAGTVRLTAVPIVINRILVPALPGLIAEHPRITVELVADPRNLSPSRRETDIALRFGKPEKEMRAVSRPIGKLRYAVYEPIDKPTDTLPWIHYESNMSELPQQRWMDRYAGKSEEAGPVMMANDAEAIIAGVAAGLGRSILPCAIADRHPQLIRTKEYPGIDRELWLMFHSDLRYLARIKAAIRWIENVFEGLATS